MTMPNVGEITAILARENTIYSVVGINATDSLSVSPTLTRDNRGERVSRIGYSQFDKICHFR